MEQHLLRAFAGLINELRQLGLGFSHYIWRCSDDDKVRSAHAHYDDRTFRWDDPPEGGHPGQAYNCRCHAEPMVPRTLGNVLLADFVLPADGAVLPGDALGRRLAGGLIARTPAGLALYAALEANGALQRFTDSASQQHISEAAAVLGADLGTVEGLWAAITYASAKEAAATGGLPGVPKDGAGAEIFAQGMALYALHDPLALGTWQGFQAAMQRVESGALQAWRDGRLRVQDGSLAAGWAEVFPELTDDERRLGQLPGFTPERLDQFREEYPAEVLGLPDHTGHGPVKDPGGNVVSTPTPEGSGPDIAEARGPEDFTTPEGNVIRGHGGKGSGKDYMLEKGHTPESVDEIIANPVSQTPSSRGDTSTGGSQRATILFGRSGDWVVVNDVTGEVISVNDRHNPRQEPPFQEKRAMDLDSFIAKAVTARGISYIKPEVLEVLMPILKKRGFWVTRLEAYEMRGEREITNLEFAVIGLDGPENWEEHHDIDRHTRLVMRKLDRAKASGMPIEFQVWIEKED